VAVAVPRPVAAAAEFQGLGTPGNSQPSGRAEKHLMLSCYLHGHILNSS